MQQSAMTEAVLYETRGPVAIITINRPEARNAMNQAVREGFSKVWPRFEQDASVRVGILAGAGPTFCAGLDLKEAADLGVGVPPRDWMPVLGDNFQVSKPVIGCWRRCATCVWPTKLRDSPSPKPGWGVECLGRLP